MSQKLTIAALIPAHNEEAMIATCVESCLRQTRRFDEIIVINDGSTDDTQAILQQFNDTVTIIHIPHATGNKSRAQKIGISSITSDIFVATDGDTILDRRFVEEVERVFVQQPDTMALAGYVKSTTYNYLTALRQIEYVIGQDFYKHAQSYIDFLMVIPGCAGAFKSSLFQDGILSIEHDTLTEDLDFTYKLHEKGLKVQFAPKAVVYTQDPHTLRSYVNQMRRWFGGGWQNLAKHRQIIFKNPAAALQLTMIYLEGMIFAVVFFTLPLINFLLFIQLLVIHLMISLLSGLYAAFRSRRLDLLIYSPLLVFIRVVNTWVFVEQFISEVVLQKKRIVWFTPERRHETIS